MELDEAAFTAATTLGDIERLIDESSASQARPYPYPEWPHRLTARLVRLAFLYSVTLPLTGLLAWVRVRGKERLSGERGPVLFISNHIT